jgi:DNA-binding NarL/FixJ family response regulator
VLDRARTGSSTLMTVVGPQGIGKTRLLHEAAAAARHRGFRLLCGPAAPDGPQPQAPVPTLVVLDGPVCPDNRVPPRGQDGRRCSHTVWMTAHRSGAPMADHRAPEADPATRRERIVLRPLAHPAVLQLASDLLGARPGEPLQQLLKQAGGHPRLLVELLRGLRDQGCIKTPGGVAHLVPPALYPRARFYVNDILDQCSSLCRQLLCVMAVLDDETPFDLLGPLLDTSTASLIVVLEEACATGLVHDDGTRPVFGSALARCLVSETVTPVLRSALRREAASLAPAHRPSRDGRTAVGDTARRHGDRLSPGLSAATPTALGDQQLVLVRLVARGLSNQDIADRVGLSPHTVNYHLRKLFRAFGVTSRIDLLNAVERAGISWATDTGGPR